jgi:hypothetical protein
MSCIITSNLIHTPTTENKYPEDKVEQITENYRFGTKPFMIMKARIRYGTITILHDIIKSRRRYGYRNNNRCR